MRAIASLFLGLVASPARVKRAAATVRAAMHPPALRLMTYNIQWDNPDPGATLDAIARADADVVMMQEVTAPWQDALVARFGATHRHHRFRIERKKSAGLAVMSRFPLADENALAAIDQFPAQRAVVDGPGGPVQLLNVHLRPAIDRGSWVRGYLTTPPVRRREIEAFWRQLEPAVPTVVAGDFNEVPAGSAVGFVEAQGLARARPHGPATWRHVARRLGRNVDVLRLDIDHVLVRGLASHDAEVLDDGASDHRPVVVTLAPC